MPAAAKKDDLFENGSNPLGNKETGQLRSLIERVEKVQEEVDVLKEDQKTIYAEAEGAGFDKRAMRRIVAIRKKDRAKWQEEEAVVERYLLSLGLI